MPHPTTTTNRIHALTPLTMAAALLVLLTACGTLASGDEDQDSEFAEAVERSNDEGWTPYWLGESFEAGGLTFYGPNVAEFGAEVEGGGVDYTYGATGQRPFALLRIVVYSKPAWDIVRSHQDFGGRPVDLLGRKARYTEVGVGSIRPVNQLRLIIETDDSVINAIAPALNSSPVGSPEQNPLLVEETFLAVMEQLRPYPD